MHRTRLALTGARTLSLAIALAAVLGSVSPAFAQDGAPATRSVDVVVLADGTRLEGRIVGENAEFLSLRAAGVTRAYAKDKLADVIRGVAAPTPDRAEGAEGAERGPTTSDAAAKPEQKKPKRKDERRGDAAPLEPGAKAWLRMLLTRVDDPDKAIQRSVAAGVRALGPAAMPVVQEAADAAQGEHKQALERLAASLRKKPKKDAAKGEPAPKKDDMRGAAARRGRAAMDRLSDELNLSQEQRPQAAKVIGDYRRQSNALRRRVRDGQLTEEEAQAELAALQDTGLEAMRAILDETQFLVFEEYATRLFGR
jgi:hypothetical protein